MQGVMEDNLETEKRTTWQEAIRQWRALPGEEKLRRSWASIPHSVTQSMAFAGEPVDLAMPEAAHARRPMPLLPASAKTNSTSIRGGEGTSDEQ